MRISVKPILPKRKLFNVPAGDAAKEQALKQLGEEAKALFEKTVETWTDKPNFTVNENENNVTVGTSSKVYSYVDKGTSVRYAVMSDDYNPKTRSRVIGSSGGRGRMIFVSRNHPKPGIVAREFSAIIQERMQKKFAATFKRVIKAYKSGEAAGL